MSVQNAIRTKLLATSVTALVGIRVSLVVSEQNAPYPRITINLISTISNHSLTGAIALAKSRVQVDCWSDRPDTASALAAVVRQELDTFRGTVGSLFINDIKIESESDGYTSPSNASQRGIYRTILDFIVWHAQSLPSP